MTDALRDGNNEIVVHVRHMSPNSRWYSGAGIYRDVWLLEYEDAHLVTDGLYVSPRELSPDKWQITVSAEAENALDTDRVALTLLDHEGNPVASGLAAPNTEMVLAVERPRLWSLEDPCRYRLKAVLTRDGQALDALDTTCGFRSVEVSPKAGLLLNHHHVVLHGVCLHHDLGCLGAAFSLPAARRQLEIMKDMGVNALRTSHNPPAPGVLDLMTTPGSSRNGTKGTWPAGFAGTGTTPACCSGASAMRFTTPMWMPADWKPPGSCWRRWPATTPVRTA